MNAPDSATWIPTLSAALWLACRILKDPRVPGNIPPRLRPFLVLLLATAAAIVDAVALGSTWRDASIRAVIAAVTAIGFQETIIAGLLGDKTEPKKPTAEAALAAIAAIAEDAAPIGKLPPPMPVAGRPAVDPPTLGGDK